MDIPEQEGLLWDSARAVSASASPVVCARSSHLSFDGGQRQGEDEEDEEEQDTGDREGRKGGQLGGEGTETHEARMGSACHLQLPRPGWVGSIVRYEAAIAMGPWGGRYAVRVTCAG